jgi:peptidoglycan/LPS O-acetylase OafA/YrhL
VFVVGFVLAGTQAPWLALEKMRWQSLGLAVLCWALFSAYASAYSDDAAVPPHALILLCRCVYGALQWLAMAAVVGFARRHLNRDNAARRYLTTAIFPVYILHQTVIVIVAHALKPANLYAPVEGLLLVLVTAASCFLGYEAIRRIAPLKPLFGLALDKRAGAPRSDAPVAARVAASAPRFLVPQDVN